MNVNSNKYTIIYATVMVLIAASLLSVAAIQLQPFQEQNRRLEKMGYILSSLGIQSVSNEKMSTTYNEYVTGAYIVSLEGKILSEDKEEAFGLKLKEEFKKQPTEQRLPVFISEKQGKRRFVIALSGKGLWGPIWGYMALKEDMSTISGIVLDHAAETPGLGSEIAEDFFEQQFEGKLLRAPNSSDFVNFVVAKPSGKPMLDHSVDGTAGATLTCRGVQNMINDNVKAYSSFLKKEMYKE